jgi:cell division protein FtsA
MSRLPILTAIDLGTDKCVTLIASPDELTGELRVLGVAAVPARGMRKSQIVDLDQVVQTITDSLDGAERMAGIDVKQAYFSVSGTHITSQNSKGVVAVATPTQEITSEDVSRVLEAARAVSLPADREVIHVIPHDYTVDSQQGIKDPVGMTGIRLEAQVHIITGMGTTLRNLQKCAQDLGIQVAGFVYSGLASAQTVLTETEKELGVVLVDVGAGSTAVCAYVEGALVYSTVLPVGARHITQDIALGCRVSLDDAEKIKIALSQSYLSEPHMKAGETKEAYRKRLKEEDLLDPKVLGLEDSTQSLSKKTLVEGIMLPRMKELFTLIGKDLQERGLISQVPAGFVITGGGAQTVGMIEVAKRSLNLPARIGKPLQLQGLIEDIQKPSYATSVGLLIYGSKALEQAPSQTRNGVSFSGFSLDKVIEFGKSLLKSVMP